LLRYFRINDPYRLLGLLAIMVVISLPLFIDAPEMTLPELKSILLGEKVHSGSSLYTEVVDSTAPLAGWFDALFEMIFGRSVLGRHILAFFIVFSQAAYLGIIFINKKAFSESTFIPSVIFAFLFFFSFDTLSLNAELLGSGFLLLALHNLFRQIEFREQGDPSIFNLGFYIGLASLFSFSFIIYLVGSVVILMIFTRSAVRSYFLMIFGFLLTHFFMMSIFYLRDGLPDLWEYYYLPNLGFGADKFINATSLWTLGAIPILFLVVSLVMLNRDARFTKYQSQLVQTMFFWMIFSFLQILYSKDLRPQSFITLIPSFSFYIAHFLLLIRRKKFAEISLWVLLISIVSVGYLARYNKIPSVHYSDLFVGESKWSKTVSDKKVLMLGDDFSIYKNNTLGSGFLNWRLSREIIEQPDYYENIVLINNSFRNDFPEVIIDPSNLMPYVFDRSPILKAKYSASGDGLYILKK
jgi:hypothetical protein